MRTRTLMALLLALWLAPTARAAEALVLVELFTSQGCNSCPPADRLLGELATRPDVVALAFHVTYWDRLGWPDSFADERFTARQRAYAQAMGSGSVYTPQMVVAGEIDVVGSDRARALRALELARAHGGPMTIEITPSGEAVLPALPDGAPVGVWAAGL